MDEKMNEFVEIKQDAAGAVVLLESLEDALKKFDRLGLRFVEGQIYATEDLHPFIVADLWALRYAVEKLKGEPKGEPTDSVIVMLEAMEDGLRKFDRLGLKFVEGMIFASLDLHRSNEVRLWALRYAKERLRDQDQQLRSSQDDSPC